MRTVKTRARSWALWLGAVVLWAEPRGLALANPVLKGDHPDPSIIRVEGSGDGRIESGYWAASTTSGWAPIFPLLYSRDLMDWQVRGAVFRTPPAWSQGDYWAPELTQDRGSYRVYYTARKKGGPLCVAVATAASPAGPYTDRGPLVCQERGSIDASTVRDETGALYLVWKEDGNSSNLATPLWTQALSEDGTRLVGTRHELLRNDALWEGAVVEGPFILRHEGWFYLFYSGNACCGRECQYALGVARSRKLLGVWEKNPRNPILAGNAAWRCPGHGSVVEDGRGRFFLIYHAYAARDSVYVGRQALLDEVSWQADGWPLINGGRGPRGQKPAPPRSGATAVSSEETTVQADFAAPELAPQWQWPADDEPTLRLYPDRGGALALAPGPRHRSPAGELPGAVLARRLGGSDTVALAALAADLPLGVRAGLAAYGDSANALGVAVGDGTAVLWRRQQGVFTVLATQSVPRASRLLLRMAITGGSRYSFAIGPDEASLTPIKNPVDGAFLPPWDSGVRVALTASGVAPARFYWLRLTELTPLQRP